MENPSERPDVVETAAEFFKRRAGDVAPLIAPLRMVKDEGEIALIKKAAEASNARSE